MEEYERYTDLEAFWTDFSTPEGHKLGYQRVLDRVKDKRRETAQNQFTPDAMAARAFFNQQLSHPSARGYFQYKKKNAWHTKKKDKEVALAWRKLLEDHPDIRAQWESCTR